MTEEKQTMKFTHASILLLITVLSQTATAADWPQYGGPDGRWIADEGDHQYLQDWSKAQLVWTSEAAEIGPGRGQAPRYGFRNADPNGINPWGGAASPIIADGLLYQVYLRPVGNIYNKAVVEKIEKQWRDREGFSIEHLRRNFSIEAETVVVAIDVKNGKTVWRQSFRGVQYNGDFAKPRGSNNSPAAGDGKVFVLGYDFVLRAHNAKTGKLLWQTEQQVGYAKDLQIMLESGSNFIRMLNNQGQPTTRTRATTLYAPPLRYADGVVLYSFDSRTLIAVDGKTGKELWRAKNSITSREVVAIWRRGKDKSACFVAVSKGGTVACFEVRSGKKLWELAGKGETFHPTVAGDLLLINETNTGGGQPVATLGCYRMSDSGAEQLWINTEEQQLTHAAASVRMFHSGRFIIGSWAGPLSHKDGKKQGRAALRFFDAETGKVDEPLRLLRGVEHTSLAPDSMVTVIGDRLYVENDSHHQSNTTRTIVDLKTNKVVTQYKAPFETAGGYGGTVINQPVVDGRLYLRCVDGHIRCYDVTTASRASTTKLFLGPAVDSNDRNLDRRIR
jgi:outer membrane protein assembly factor BamB